MPKSRSKTTSQGSASNATARATNSQSSKRKNQRKQPPGEFAVLKPRVRQISQATITSKWSPLSQPAQQHARDVLKAAKRSVVMSHWDERRRVEADVAINATLKKVEKSMSRLPVPPRTKDMFFNLEKLAENSRLLESQLTSSIHSIQLLKAEIDKEENALDTDRDRLAELQAHAKSEHREHMKQASKTHALLQVGDLSQSDDTAEKIRLKKPSEAVADDLTKADSDIASLFQQFSKHLDSMSTNHEQVHGLRDTVLGTRIDLDRVLYQDSKSVDLG